MPQWVAMGSHRFYREGDFMYFEVHGPFTLSDSQFMYAQGEAVAKEYGYVLSVFDSQDGPGMTPEARKHSGRRNREVDVKSATAVVGASMPVRVMTQLLLNVAKLAGKTVPPVLFCATNSEAMAWIQTQRQIFRAQQQQAQPLR